MTDQVSHPHEHYAKLWSRTFRCSYRYTANEKITDTVHVYTRTRTHTQVTLGKITFRPHSCFPSSSTGPILQYNCPHSTKFFVSPETSRQPPPGPSRQLLIQRLRAGGCLSWAIKLTSHLHAQPSLRISGTNLHCRYCTRTTSPSSLPTLNKQRKSLVFVLQHDKNPNVLSKC